jgi:hypothetical protein
MILWAAYTCMRPGETFSARYALLKGDTYDLRREFNSTLGRTEYYANPAGDATVAGPVLAI